MRSSRLAVLVILLALAGGLAVAAIVADRNSRSGEPPLMSQNEPALGTFVPFTVPQPAPPVGFTDLSGKAMTFKDFAGKAVLVNLWATWCAPCRREMPSLERLQRKLGDRIAVLAISEDIGGAKAVGPFVAKLGLKRIKPYLDPKSAVGQAFKVDGLPTSILIDREGRVEGRVEGEARWDSPAMLAVIAPFLPPADIVNTSLPREPR
jgi:thiol-disulfide isomerase/thioredoxin